MKDWLRRWSVALYIDLHDLWVGMFWRVTRRCDLGARCPFGGAGGPQHASYPLEVSIYLLLLPTVVLRFRWSGWRQDRIYHHVTEGLP